MSIIFVRHFMNGLWYEVEQGNVEGRIGFLARFIKLVDIYTEYPQLVIRHRVRDIGDLDPT